MTETRGRRGRRADLVVALVTAALAAVVVFSPAGEFRPLAVVVGIPFVLLVPGYALVSAVFPRAGETGPLPGDGTSWLGRLGLSVGGSVVAVGVVGGVLDFSVWGFSRDAVVAGLCVWTLVATAVAWYRRRTLTGADSAGADHRAIWARLRALVAGEGIVGVVLTLVVVVAAVGAVGVVVEQSAETEPVTELYILGETESGERVADGYPSNLTAGEPTTLDVGVGATTAAFEGTVVARLERVRVRGDSVRVTESRQLGSFAVSVPADERVLREHTVRPTMVGERLRLTYRLYQRGSSSPRQQVHIWVSVAPQR
jgi:uncharacterized membrane protein